MYGSPMEWNAAIEAVVYELARRNGESPMDRGARLRLRLLELAEDTSFEDAFERLAQERGYRNEESGEECLARVETFALGSAVLGDGSPRGLASLGAIAQRAILPGKGIAA
jgi:hypothetical protein